MTTPTTSKDIFSFAGFASVEHINARKEGQEGDKELAVDLKLKAIVGEAIARRFDEALPAFLWDEEGNQRSMMIGAIPLGYELEGYKMKLGISEREHFGVKVKKFQISAIGKRFAELTFSISFKPQADEVARIAEYLQEEMTITLDKAQQDLDLGEAK